MDEELYQCDCHKKELQQIKNELHKCKSTGQTKDKKIQKLDKKVFILTAICVGIGAIAGKETLDSIAEWLKTIGDIKGGVDNLNGVILPAPGTLALLPMVLLCRKSRRRRK